MSRARSKAQALADRETHWTRTVELWTKARNEIPQPVMECVGEFQAEFIRLVQKHQLSPPHVVIALSHLFGPVVAEHYAHKPDNTPTHEWSEAIYAGIRDAIVVAHALYCAVMDGTVVADEKTRTLRNRVLN